MYKLAVLYLLSSFIGVQDIQIDMSININHENVEYLLILTRIGDLHALMCLSLFLDYCHTWLAGRKG